MLFTETRGTRRFAKDPAVVKFGGRYFLYYSSFYSGEDSLKAATPSPDGRKAGLGIGIAVSDDLESFEPIGMVGITQECEKNGIGAPGAIVLDGKVHLFYQTYGNGKHDAICHAISDDGVHFHKDETNPIFSPSDDWCSGRAIDADVVVFGDRLYLYFATRDHEMKIQKVGVAYADVNGSFERSEWTQAVRQSVLAPEFRWEGECIEAPATIVHDGRVYLFYGGAYNCSPQQIGVAVSDDGIFFEKLSAEPFLACGAPGSWNACESGHPYVFEDEGTVHLFYQGTADMGQSWYLSRCEIEFRDGLPAVVS